MLNGCHHRKIGGVIEIPKIAQKTSGDKRNLIKRNPPFSGNRHPMSKPRYALQQAAGFATGVPNKARAPTAPPLRPARRSELRPDPAPQPHLYLPFLAPVEALEERVDTKLVRQHPE